MHSRLHIETSFVSIIYLMHYHTACISFTRIELSYPTISTTRVREWGVDYGYKRLLKFNITLFKSLKSGTYLLSHIYLQLGLGNL